ncbi:hypothetical protein WICPIJ_000419 [Wickerhamomyces pijperi]|uniref:Uncharacterized protein n=1 Tax=Wickerhamomyces pijperi TaxID=599730 RepID=A0A9P8QGB4_WICPI|nr:hypothetical protein WICPIJ_000419 [Wickerhamomyces pijperi]
MSDKPTGTTIIRNGLPLLPSDCQVVISHYTILRLQILIRQTKALLIRVKTGITSDERIVPLLNYILNLSGVFIITDSNGNGKLASLINGIWELSEIEATELIRLKSMNVFGFDLDTKDVGKKYDIKDVDAVDYNKVLNALVLVFEGLLQTHSTHLRTLKLTKIAEGELELNFDLIKPLLESPMEIQSMIKFVIASDKTKNIQHLSKMPIVLDLFLKQLSLLSPLITQLKELQTKMLEAYLKKLNYWGYILIRSFAILMRLNEIQWCVMKFYRDIQASHGASWKRIQENHQDFKRFVAFIESVEVEGKVDFITEFFTIDKSKRQHKKKMEYSMKNVSDLVDKVVSKFEHTQVIVKRFDILIKVWKDDVERQNRARNASLLSTPVASQVKQQMTRSPSLRMNKISTSAASPSSQPMLKKLSFNTPQSSSTESPEPASSSPLRRSASVSVRNRSRSGSVNSLTSPIKPPVSNQSTIRQRSENSPSIISSPPPSVTVGRPRSGSNTSTNSQQSSTLNSQRANSLTGTSKGLTSPSVSRSGSVRAARPQSVIMNQSFDIRTQLRRQQSSPSPKPETSSSNLPSLQPVNGTPKPNFKNLKGAGVTRSRSSSLQGPPRQNTNSPANAAASAIFRKNGTHVVNSGPRANSLQSITELPNIQESIQDLKTTPVAVKSAMKSSKTPTKSEIGSSSLSHSPVPLISVSDSTQTTTDEPDFETDVLESLGKVQLENNITPVKQILKLDIDETGYNSDSKTKPVPIKFVSSPSAAVTLATPIGSPLSINEKPLGEDENSVEEPLKTEPSTSKLPVPPSSKTPEPLKNVSNIEPPLPSTVTETIKKVRFTGVPEYNPLEDKPSNLQNTKRKGMTAALALKFKNPMLNPGPGSKSSGMDKEFLRQERLTFIKLRNGDLNADGGGGFKASYLNSNDNGNSSSSAGKGFGGRWKLFR